MRLPKWIFGLVSMASMPASVAQAQPADHPWPEECKLQRQASLPFTIKNAHVLIEVRLNDVPRHFIIDTGGFMSSVTEDVAKEQALRSLVINDNVRISGIGGGRTERYAIADTLTVGNLKAGHVRLLMEPSGPPGEGGLVGPEYLRNFDLDFDFANKTLNLFKPHRCSDHVVYWGGPVTAIPFRVSGQGHILVSGTLDGVELEVEVDTGSAASLIGAHTVAEKFVTQSETGTGTGTITLHGASGGTTTAVVHRFGELVLGDFTIKSPPLLIAADEDAWRSEDASLLLGLPELRMFHVYIAYREHRMYLTPSAAN